MMRRTELARNAGLVRSNCFPNVYPFAIQLSTSCHAQRSSGRGGVGNMVHTQPAGSSRSHSRGPSPLLHSIGRGGAGNVVRVDLADAATISVEDDAARLYALPDAAVYVFQIDVKVPSRQIAEPDWTTTPDTQQAVDGPQISRIRLCQLSSIARFGSP